MSRFWRSLASMALVGVAAIGLTGCGAKSDSSPAATEHHEGDGHEHEGEHHEGDGHDHSKEGAGHSAGEHSHLAADDIELPKDFDSAVARIKTCHTTVKAALESGELHDAHDPVDELTIVLERVMPLAKESGVDRSHWKEINLLVKEIGGKFDAVHEAVEQHSDGTVATPTVEEAISRLEVIAQAPRAAKQ